MSNPLERIIALIGRTPGVRLVEIADQLDIDADAVERILAPALADGSVLAVNVPIFDGKRMPSYSLKSEAAALVEPVSAPAAKAEPTLQPPDGSQAQNTAEPKKTRGVRKVAEPTARRERVPVDSIADRALAFIQSQPGRRASNKVLRKQLALPKGKYPSNYFRRFIEDGTLVRVRNGWAATPLDVGGRAHDDVREPAVALPLAEGVQSHESHELRYALWSDGMLELRRGAMTVALLTVAERIALRAFLAVGSPV
jgi:hypothetical protein